MIFSSLLETFNIKNRFPILSVIQKEKPKTLWAARTFPKALANGAFGINILQFFFSYSQKDGDIEIHTNAY